jgi:eukaryotic-like serine/threonine-protein kinase
MAEVYRAKDTRLGRDVAIKVVSEALGGDGAFLERFDREAKLAASLAHPNVVALFDVGLQDGKPYFVTELLQGESLRERLAKGPIPLTKALEWAAQMAQGVAAAHERGIVHRDLKPENIFITRDGHVKLLDFGIAKLIETAQAATPHGLMDPTVSPSGSGTGTGMVLGTPGYMSPEQVRGDPVDARTDFFSLGAVLYEMLSGHRAFPAGPVVESGYAILHNEPEPLPTTVPGPVAQVVNRCLEKDLSKRFQSARDLAFNLELLRSPTGSTGPIAATLDGVPTEPAPWRRWFLRLGFLLALSGAVGVTYLSRRGSSQLVQVPTVEPITFRLGFVSAGRFTPDGRVVFSAAWDGEPSDVFVRAPASLEAQSLRMPGARLLDVSAKGEIAVAIHPVASTFNLLRYSPATLAVVPGAGGTPRELAPDVLSAAWSPSGELAAVRTLGSKRQLEFPLGTVIFETDGLLFSPRVSPTGDLVAVIHWQFGGSDELLLVSRNRQVTRLKTFPLVQDSPEKKGPLSLAWLPSGDEIWFQSEGAVWATSLSGATRLVYRGTEELRLEDISRNGTLLLRSTYAREEIGTLGPNAQREKSLSVLGAGDLAALSDDGTKVLFRERLEGGLVYLRTTDAAPPVKLGNGWSLALSPDDKWALVVTDDPKSPLSLLPVGAGAARTVVVPFANFGRGRWLQDNQRIVVMAQPEHEQMSLYVVSLDGGTPERISPAVTPYYFEVSRDDSMAAARALDGIIKLFPLQGGDPVSLPELGLEVVPIGWSSDGDLWVRELGGVPAHLLRFDVKRRRVVEERSVGPSDSTGVWHITYVQITPNGQHIAFDYERSFDRLLLVDGLVPRQH